MKFGGNLFINVYHRLFINNEINKKYSESNSPVSIVTCYAIGDQSSVLRKHQFCYSSLGSPKSPVQGAIVKTDKGTRGVKRAHTFQIAPSLKCVQLYPTAME